MELYQDSEKFIILSGEDSLWCNRGDARLQPRFGVKLGDAWPLKCCGIIYGVIGKIQFFPGADWRLLVISKRTLLGSLPGDHEVYRIDRVAVLALSSSESPEADLEFCAKHQSGGRSRRLLGVGGGGPGGERESNQQKGLGQAWSKIKTAAANMKEKNVKDRDLKDKEKLERRFVEELLKMFNDSESFYYSPTGDLTNSLQRQFSGKHDTTDTLWKKCDERFFWNKFMIKDLLNSEDPYATKWILPIIQGYCKIEQCINTFQDDDAMEGEDKKTAPFPPEEFKLVLISRRSVNRAGTRYRRRGVDDDGYVANFVETEQIVCTATHDVAFVQVRGSVPVYWSQPGLKYRPPPRLDKGREDTQSAFKKHFDNQLELYKSVAVISLVDQSGREKVISDAFMDNIMAYNSPFLSYITFDFHEHCRGMKFENVAVLVEGILDVIKDVRYCWTDAKGIICGQRGVFRVNCMDCLDRTNVVQAALARHIVEQQLKKLGKLLPDQILPASIRTSFQEMWASNGDAISRQYAGTAALKGDFTRTGERRFTGVMKDGYNSANRYYVNRFKAIYRQTLIDMMLGNPVTEDISALIAGMKNGTEEEQWTMEREECVVQLVQHCQQLLLGDEQQWKNGWALVDPFYSPDGDSSQDQDVILLLTNHDYYVASYDDEVERITQYEQIRLKDLEKIEIGLEPTLKSKHLFIRIFHKNKNDSGFFHTLRTIQHRTLEDAKSVLLSIADEFAVARGNLGLGLRVEECRLDKKKSKSPPHLTQISPKSCLSGWSKPCSSHDGEPAAEHKASEPSFAPHHRTRFQGLRTSFSDTCLVQRRLEDVANEPKTSTSAPQSCSCSSGSDEDNDSGDTEDMEYCIPTITANPLEGNVGQENTACAVNEVINSNAEVYNGTRAERDEDEETGFTEEEQDKNANIKLEEGGISEGSGFVLGSGTEEDKEPQVKLDSENNNEADSAIEDENRAQLVVEGSVEKVDMYEEPKKDEEGRMIGELHDEESHLENDNNVGSKLASTEDKQENRVGNSFKLHEDDLEIEFHGTVASLRLSQSSGELSTMASSRVEDTSQVSPEKRRFGARFLYRAPGNRVPRMNIFASAHARGRTLIPELRSKLSSISQQVRSRSPRLNAKRPGLHSELNDKEKECQTRIIKL